MNVHEVMREVERIARRQHGVVHRDQLIAAGVTAAMLRYRLRTKSWIQLAPKVYALASFPATWQRQYKAAELATPGSSLFGLAGAHLLRWDGFGTVRPEVVASHTANHRNRLAVVHRAIDVKTTTVDRISVTTSAQTLCDLLTQIKLDRWERACDLLLLTNRMPLADLDERRLAYEAAHRPAIELLRALIHERSEGALSRAESELELLLQSAVALVPGCPPVHWQAPAPWDPTKRVDGLIDEWGLILEADGRAWHARVKDFDSDRWRDSQAAAHGLRVQRFTYTHLTHRLPEVVELIRAAGQASSSAA
ncbi:MAG: hypothetical protein QOD92_401 [Acidimicrobiaceae bacterium]|jgi:hypothetical protein